MTTPFAKSYQLILITLFYRKQNKALQGKAQLGAERKDGIFVDELMIWIGVHDPGLRGFQAQSLASRDINTHIWSKLVMTRD